MRLPDTRYSSSRHSGGVSIFTVLALSAVVAGIVGGVIWFTRDRSPLVPIVEASTDEALFELWESGNYQELIDVAEERLFRTPLDGNALSLRGFAAFYLSLEQIDPEQRQSLLQSAVADLRRALLIQSHALRPQILYVLGKAYYHRGHLYYDLSIDSLRRAQEAGLDPLDSYEYLALASRSMGQIDAAVAYLQTAIELSTDPIYPLTLGETLVEVGDFVAAEPHLRRAAHVATETVLRQQALLTLARVMRELRRFEEALTILQAVAEENPNSAEARFGMGEVYLATGDTDRARAEWREAIRRNPNHIESLQRLREY